MFIANFSVACFFSITGISHIFFLFRISNFLGEIHFLTIPIILIYICIFSSGLIRSAGSFFFHVPCAKKGIYCIHNGFPPHPSNPIVHRGSSIIIQASFDTNENGREKKHTSPANDEKKVMY